VTHRSVREAVPAPYLAWAKTRPTAQFDLAGSSVLPCAIADLPGADRALSLDGRNDDGYPPLREAIAQRYGVTASQVTTATGAAGANFLVFAALLQPGDDVLVERPGYDPLLGAARLAGATTRRFERELDRAFSLDPDCVKRAMTPGTKLIVVTSPQNPTGALATEHVLREIGRIAESAGAHVLVDEVYLDQAESPHPPAATLGGVFISTSSLTKSYGLAALRCGWVLSSPALAERLRRTRDVIDGAGSIVCDRLATLAFHYLDALSSRAHRILEANRRLVRERLAAEEMLDHADLIGSTTAFPRIRGLADTAAFCRRLLAEKDTAVVPGRFFEAPAHFRVGLGGESSTLEAGLAAVHEALHAAAF
jgi:aspartate/methionine/tyrosine aminotransferase